MPLWNKTHTASRRACRSWEEIAQDVTEIVDVESITEVPITGDAVVDSVLNDEPTITITEVIEDSTPQAMTIVTVEEEIVPVEIAVDSAFDNEPIVETFNTFVETTLTLEGLLGLNFPFVIA